jgi:CRP/FNR family transcriptional regulator, cyclic AMP receptor protein
MCRPIEELAARLRTVALFAQLDDKGQTAIARQMRQNRFDPDDAVVVAEQERPVRAGRMFVILEGSAEVRREGTVLATLGPDDHFGEMALLDGEPRSADVITTTPLEVAALVAWNFAALVHEEPEIALAVIRTLAARLRAAEPTPHNAPR